MRATLKAMRALVIQFRVNPEIRMLAESIIQNVPQKNYYLEAEAVYNWIQQNIRYTQDCYDVETLKIPIGDGGPQDYSILNTRQGDCDDFSVLNATLLNSIGHPVKFAAIATEVPDQFTHVYIETRIGPRWVASDPTEPYGFGWTPPHVGGVFYCNV